MMKDIAKKLVSPFFRYFSGCLFNETNAIIPRIIPMKTNPRTPNTKKTFTMINPSDKTPRARTLINAQVSGWIFCSSSQLSVLRVSGGFDWCFSYF